jgi:superfamily II DNA/RNA helicase
MGLILAPARDLAAQITEELVPLAAASARRVHAYGGVGDAQQRRQLNHGVDLVVACPGWLVDLLGQGALELGAIETVVDDEADRMSDMGFLPDVRRILDRTPATRETLLFSATLDGAAGVLSHKYHVAPVHHAVEVDSDRAARLLGGRPRATNRPRGQPRRRRYRSAIRTGRVRNRRPGRVNGRLDTQGKKNNSGLGRNGR